MSRLSLGSVVVVVLFAAAAGVATLPSGEAIKTSANGAAKDVSHVRVNQVGYLTGAPKKASLFSSADRSGDEFTVVTESGQPVFTGVVGSSVKKWSKSWPFVYELDFSELSELGTYRIAIEDAPAVSSPPFAVGGSELFEPLLFDTVRFFRGQRDGSDVDPSILKRKPSHLEDENATAYRKPKYRDFALVGDLRRVGGPVDVSGGWFDAGDYVKYVQTSSFVETLLLVATRDLGPVPGSQELLDESRFGIEWLDKMWDAESQTLYYQVAIGDGNYDTILGDHDTWRLPERDDKLDVRRGDPLYYVKYRPALRAGAPGSSVSPNLAGRLAASFALCTQVFDGIDQELAGSCLHNAQTVFDLAKTSKVKRLLSAAPHGYYPESEWHSDMELGAAEIYLAMTTSTLPPGLPHADPNYYLENAAHWAGRYIAADEGDSLNLYDVAGLAHYELVKAIRHAGAPAGLEVDEAQLLASMASQLSDAQEAASGEPFGLGAYYGYDLASRAFGLAAEASFYAELTGLSQFDEFATDQLDYVLGDNPWGVSFLIGAGTRFPQCPHHQIANLRGSLDGSPPVLEGAVVGGPNHAGEFQFLGVPGEANKCPPGGGDEMLRFSGKGIRYSDTLKAWPTNEPAIDFTVVGTLLFQRILSR